MSEYVTYSDRPKHSAEARATTADEIIAEREKTHGAFSINARVAQVIRYALREAEGWSNLSFEQREALDHIAGKIGRIVAGGAPCPDHFLDISGYARLGQMATIKRMAGVHATE